MNPLPQPFDLPRLIFSVLAFLLLMAASLWILKPFLLPLVWATMIAVATWPMLLGVEKRLRQSRKLAVLVMTAGMLVLLILPLTMAVKVILENVDDIKDWVRVLSAEGLPPLPAWIGDLPLVGQQVADLWARVAAAGPGGLSTELLPYVQKMLTWFVNNAGGFGLIIVEFLLALVMTSILYAKGETAVIGVRSFFRRLAGERGDKMVILAGKAIRAVAMGIVVTALIQATLGGLGLWVAGIPGVPLLTAVMFLLAIAQIGVVPVLAVAVGWLFWTEATLWGVALLVWTVVVGSLDNVIRPILIRKGADLPLLLILAGVIGGLVAFGVIGLFAGPVILAVAYTLVKEWVGDAETKPGDAAG